MMIRTGLAIKAATTFALAVLPGQLLANPKPRPSTLTRKVILMDFSRPSETDDAASRDAPFAASPIEDVERLMASSFTNSSSASLDGPAPTEPQPNYSAGFLGNPFVTHAISPFGSIPSPVLYSGGSCSNYVYQDDFSHGRAAAERRRMIYPLVHKVACEQGLPIGLFDALIMQESRYKHTAISPKGALGLAQLMPGTARQLGTNPYTVIDNLRGGARYLRQQVDRFGRYDLALAAYNAGPGRVARHGRVPAIAETIGYVRNISANWGDPGRVKLAAVVSPSGGRIAKMIFMPYYERRAD